MPKREHDGAYKAWRKKVRLRDGNRCRMPSCPTGAAGRKCLQVHHIRRWHEHPSLRFDVKNGITLCRQCHESVTGKEEQFAEVFASLACGSGRNPFLDMLLRRSGRNDDEAQ